MSTESHVETIRCPSCGSTETATVEHLWPFDSYVHDCKCGYVITESEWNSVDKTHKKQ
jgi:uncharacterized Zn finger protein